LKKIYCENSLEPRGLTLLEVLVALTVISAVSLISFRVVSELTQVHTRSQREELRQKSVFNLNRLLKADFQSYNYYSKQHFFDNFFFDGEKLELPGGITWKLESGELHREKRNQKKNSRTLVVLEGVNALRISLWLNGVFVSYNTVNKKDLIDSNTFGIEVEIIKKSNNVIRQVFRIRGFV
tara:strand:+ start:68149 stop:68691 length:543 start_codon:yes stop_codon:yes gene_type:complete